MGNWTQSVLGNWTNQFEHYWTNQSEGFLWNQSVDNWTKLSENNRINVPESDLTHLSVGNMSTLCAYNLSALVEFNAAYAKKVIPAIAYLAVIMALGILGNAVVCLVYSGTKRSVMQRFVISLALMDLSSSVIIIPVELVKMHFNYTMGLYEYWCKSYRSIYAFFTISSCGLLIVIAVDRYRMICKPFKRRTSLNTARNAIFICLFLSLCISAPAWVLNGRHSIQEKGYLGFICSVADEYRQSYLPFVYHVTLCCLHLIGCFILAVLYIHIWKRLAIQRAFRLMLGRSLRRIRFSKETRMLIKPITSQDNLIEASSSEKSLDCGKYPGDDDEQVEISIQKVPGQKGGNDCGKTPLRSTKKSVKQTMCQKKKNSFLDFHRTTFVMLVVTLLFIVSFIPYFYFVILEFVNIDLSNRIKDTYIGVYNLFIRFHFLNIALNPIVYSFVGTQFRRDLVLTFNNIFRRK